MKGIRIVSFHTFTVVMVECECCILYGILKVTPNSYAFKLIILPLCFQQCILQL